MKLIKMLFITGLTLGGFIIQASELPNPDENNLANFHLKDETCGNQCHINETPSEDLVFENKSCVECHDTMSELDGRQHNIKHQDNEEMECIECHLPHEEFDPKEICTDCHEEDDEELKDFYSSRIDQFIKLYPTLE